MLNAYHDEEDVPKVEAEAARGVTERGEGRMRTVITLVDPRRALVDPGHHFRAVVALVDPGHHLTAVVTLVDHHRPGRPSSPW